MSIYQNPVSLAVQALNFKGTKRVAKLENDYAALRSQIEAIYSTQAVVEYHPDGTVVEANEMFLKLMGYSMGEITGKHHRMFVLPEQVQTEQYASFWKKTE